MTNPSTSSPSDALVRVEHLGVSLEGREVLNDVSFDIRPGEFTGLIGANGTGKTTLLRALVGFIKPTSGRVTLRGEPLSRQSHALGYVPQKVHFDADMPVRARDLVALGIDGHRYGFFRRTRGAGELVEQLLEAVEATGFADRKVGALSGGEQQRVLIAHALAAGPELLLLDEPLANLDPGNAQEIVSLLHRVSTSQGVAVLVSAHEMNALLPVLDRVVYVAQGRVASGPTNQVVTSEVLSGLYGHHVDVVRVHGRVLVVTDSPHPEQPAVADHPEFVIE